MAITATGGTVATFTSAAVNYQSHTFTTTDTFKITGSGAVQVLIVGGGGGGALGGGGESNDTNRGNGGGGGGVYYNSAYTMNAATYPIWDVIVGTGGSGGRIGAAATIGGITSLQDEAVPATARVSSSFADGAFFQLTGSAVGKFYVTSSATQTDVAPVYYVVQGATATLTLAAIAAKINSLPTFGLKATGSAATMQITASVGGTAGNSYQYRSSSIIQPFAGGLDSDTTLTGSYGGYGGQPAGGAGGSGGGSFPTGAAAIFAGSGSAGGIQSNKAGAGGGGAAAVGGDSSLIYIGPFTNFNGGDGGAGKPLTLQVGTTKYYGAGGGGGGWVNSGPGSGGVGGSGIGGSGGAGNQQHGGNGTDNTGAGGGGGANSDQAGNWGCGGEGGDGVVIITYTV